MNKIKLFFLLIVFFMISSCLNNETRKTEKDISILYDENINIEKIMNKMYFIPFKNDSLTKKHLSEKLTEIGADTITETGGDSIVVSRFVMKNYGDIFKNNHKYLIVYEQSMKHTGYIWFLRSKLGFIKFYERDSGDGLYIKDSIFDTNKDGECELVVYKHSGGSTGDYKIIYYLNNDGLIINKNNPMILKIIK